MDNEEGLITDKEMMDMLDDYKNGRQNDLIDLLKSKESPWIETLDQLEDVKNLDSRKN